MTNLILDRKNSLLTITLDRPEVLNALNGEMVKALSLELSDIAKDPDIKVVFIKGAGGKAFCAGGDIKAARLGAMAIKDGRMELKQVVQFFVEEYGLNRELYHFKTPIISFMNGITMGGGVGIARACRYRIATEQTRWAMPEVSIGFFPDVGAAYYLAKAPHNVGMYLALTGGSLSNPADLIKCGFATHFIPVGKEAALIEDLSHEGDIGRILDGYSVDPGHTELPYDKIEECFGRKSVEEILANLDHDQSEWAVETARIIRSKSPTSLKVAYYHVQKASRETFDDVIARDLKLAGKFLQGHDLIEGVRAVVVDKDKSPKWQPATLEAVKIAEIESYFS